MKSIFSILVMLLLLVGKEGDLKYTSSFRSDLVVLDKAPEFFVLEWKEGTRLSPKKIDFFIGVDSIVRHEVVALLDKNEQPVLYTSNIGTPVCADGECKLMNLRLYWTLLGEYAGFDRYPELPLTKHDHDEFKVEDYQKLHALLTNDKSILGRRRVDQLVEKPKMRTVNGVDAVSGATIARVKESVVSGALYSCYVAWYLVHGDIRDKLKNHTLSVLSRQMVFDMINSKNADYHLYALRALDDTEYTKHYLQISEVFKTSTPLVRSIIAKSLIEKFRNTPDLQRPFWYAFEHIDLGSRSLLLKHLDKAPVIASEILSARLGSMSKNQLITFLNHLVKKEKINAEVQGNLEAFANSDSETYAYLAKEFLEEHQ